MWTQPCLSILPTNDAKIGPKETYLAWIFRIVKMFLDPVLMLKIWNHIISGSTNPHYCYEINNHQAQVYSLKSDSWGVFNKLQHKRTFGNTIVVINVQV